MNQSNSDLILHWKSLRFIIYSWPYGLSLTPTQISNEIEKTQAREEHIKFILVRTWGTILKN